MSEQPIITKEQMEAYQRQQQTQEQEAMRLCIAELNEVAHKYGFEIAAIPQIADDGRISAAWGIRRKAQ